MEASPLKIDSTSLYNNSDNNNIIINSSIDENINMITRRRSSLSSSSSSNNNNKNGEDVTGPTDGSDPPPTITSTNTTTTKRKNAHHHLHHCTLTIDIIEDLIARIVHRVDLQQSHEGDGTTAERWKNDEMESTMNNASATTDSSSSSTIHPSSKGNGKDAAVSYGPLTCRELSELSFLCSAITNMKNLGNNNYNNIINSNKNGGVDFSNVAIDSVLGIMELLDRHVQLAVATNVVENTARIAADTTKSPSQITVMIDQWLTMGNGQRQIATIRSGLEASAIILYIVTTPNIDRRVLSEDTIKGVVTLMRLHLSRHLLPALNQTGQFISSDGAPKKDLQGSPNTKRRRISESANGAFLNAKDLKKVYKYIVATMELQLTLMERMEGVVTSLPLDDQQVLMVTSGVLPSLEIDCNSSSLSNSKESFQAQQLQRASISILTSAFRKYPMHRDIILEDLFPVMLNLPTAKRSLRTFPVRYISSPTTTLQATNSDIVGSLITSGGSQPHYIQMIAALILSLVQSCILRPTIVSDETNAGDGTANGAKKPEKLLSGLRSSIVAADTFIRFFLKRCIKSKGDSTNEYRPVLVNLVEDLLLVLIIPEYPAAELLLGALQRRLNQDLSLASPIFNPSNTAPEITYLNFAMDLMGKICSVQARLLAVSEEKPLSLIVEPPMSNHSGSEQEEDMHCYCKSQHTDVLRIQCDHCSSIYHGVCVGLPDEESIPSEWFCDHCTLGRIILSEKQEINRSEEDSHYLDQIYAMRHIYYTVSSNQARLMGESVDDHVKFHLARWIDELDRKFPSSGADDDKYQRSKSVALSKLFKYWDDTTCTPKLESLSEAGGIRLIINLMTQTSQFFLSFRKQVEFILKHMSDENPQFLRKLCMKIIEKCVEGDQNLMLLPIIKKAVSKRLSDESTAVREAALSLVGNYITRSPIAVKTYHSVLIPCLTDSGVSVRKRAVKIFQSILTRNPQYQGRKEVFNILLQRSIDPKEEDTVRDLVDDTLCMLWFRSGTIPVSQQRTFYEPNDPVVSIPGVVTPNTPIEQVRRTAMQSRADVTAEQMMEVVQAWNSAGSLEAVLTKLLKNEIESAGNSSNKQAETGKGFGLDGTECSQIVDSLCELLIVIDEQRAIRLHIGRDISATLKTLAIFAAISPSALLKHIDSLLPYLKADNGVSFEDESVIIGAVCDILYRLAPVLDNHTVPKQTSLIIAKDFTKISYKFGPAVLLSVIRAFSALANESSFMGQSIFTEKLLALAKIFYGYAMKKNDIDDFSLIDEQLKSSVHRALTVLGIICEYRVVDVDSSTFSDCDVIDTNYLIPDMELTWETYTKACYGLFQTYLKKKDSPTKCRALAAMKGIFVAHPQLLLQLDHVGLFDNIMSDAAGEALQLEALECWRSILEAEERRVESGRAAAMMDSNENVTLSKRISGDQNGDATLFGGVLTNHSKRLYEMTKDSRASIRHSTLTLLGLLLRQGLLNPNEVIPYLFALQGDTENESIRLEALQLLIIEGEKRPDVLRQRICAGVKEAYNFQRAIYPNKTQACAVVIKQSEHLIVECIFGSVFEECIVKNRKQRLGLYKSLIGLFEADQSDRAAFSSKSSIKDLSLLSFAAQILAHLPYNVASDPLYIIYYVTSITVLQGQYIAEQLSDLLRQNGISSSGDTYEYIATEDVFEKAARSKFPSRTQEARQLSAKNFDLALFKKLVNEGTVVSLLLRLKSFLCKTYNLSETRCLEFDPNERGRICEKTIPPIKFHQMFDATVAVTDGPLDRDLLLREYAEFRRLVRLENAQSPQVRTSTPVDELNNKESSTSLKRTSDEIES